MGDSESEEIVHQQIDAQTQNFNHQIALWTHAWRSKYCRELVILKSITTQAIPLELPEKHWNHLCRWR